MQIGCLVPKGKAACALTQNGKRRISSNSIVPYRVMLIKARAAITEQMTKKYFRAFQHDIMMQQPLYKQVYTFLREREFYKHESTSGLYGMMSVYVELAEDSGNRVAAAHAYAIREVLWWREGAV